MEDIDLLNIATAPRRDSAHWQQDVISWGDVKSWLDSPADHRECGNYVLGSLQESTVTHPGSDTPCTGLHRRKTTIVDRDALALDVDYPGAGFFDGFTMTFPNAAVIHSTYSSTTENPRYRLIIPLARSVAPDEYHYVATAIMEQLGIDQFDSGSVQAERYMFKPSYNDPAYWEAAVLDGPPLDPDKVLQEFDPDLSTVPAPKPHKNKRDPFAIEGTIGAFNRAYEDWDLLIEKYELPYERRGGRYTLVGASAAAGMSEVAPGLVYSHHANDPAYGVTCSAFDLARLHLFGHLDEDISPSTPVNRRPSNTAMLERATEDPLVVRDLVGADFEEEMSNTADAIQQQNWKLGMVLSPRTGAPTDSITNWDLIMENDRVFEGLYFNELTMAIETKYDLPWRAVEDRPSFSAGDRSSFALHIERVYNLRPNRSYLDDLINDAALNRRVNPVRDYLQGLEWDGVPRVETALPGVTPTPYTRLVARKALVAAVARMLDPGCKWDHMLILYGDEGLGKSYWVDKVSKGYSASLGRINDKDTLITMQRSWIMTSDEGHSMKKADFDAQKEFITRTADIFRMPYDREAQVHKRHSVIWGTTNDEVFLRRQEGNRRFLIVHCERPVDFDALTDDYVDQLWAEAVQLYRAGESLFLDKEQSELAADTRENFTEEDALEGQIQEYLDTLVPADWDQYSPESRQMWLANAADGFSDGTARIDYVCSVQIWVEALGRRRGEHRRVDLLQITEALNALPGWTKLPGRKRVPGYGPQLVFKRDGAE